MRSRLWRVVISVGMAGISMTLSIGVGTAAAHPDDPHESDKQHAVQDRAGVSVTQIEKETRANALKIKQATGEAPGGRTADQQVANEGASSQAATDPGQGGQWSAVLKTPVVPVFQAVLPNGKVLMWDSVGDQAVDTYPNHTFTRATVWDPKANTSKQVNVAGYNIFCAGYVQLADGRVLVAGGNRSAAQDGIVQTHIFDWRTETWTRGSDMAAARWYPSVAALGNGEALIVAGGPATAEVHQTDGRLRRLTGFSSFDDRVYPFLVPRPDGKVELVGPHNRMDTMRTAGAGALTATRNRDGINRTYGSFAIYDIGKVIVAGGGSVTEDGRSTVPTKTAAIVDVNGAGTTVRATSSMSVGRRQANLTILADGSVLATGGQSSSANGLVDLDNPVFAAERWDPATETWTVLAGASRVRQYHSTATLLPDGRVLTGGGGICGTCTTKGYLEKNIEYFSPPYLFRKDGTGSPASRPVIDSAPAATGYAQTFAVATEQAGSIGKVGLVRLGAPTHSEDQGQRYVPLTFTKSGSGLTVTAPATPNIAPPGYYMLFVTDTAGVPSVAKIVRLEATYEPVGTATRNDYNGDKNADIAVWRPSNGTWYVRGISTTAFGLSADKPVQADYDGDNRTDIAVWRPSSGGWHIRGRAAVGWGVAGDIPVPADYDGNGEADLAVWRPSTRAWYLRGISTTTYGLSTDKPVPGDYNGDGKADIAVWRPSNGTWYVRGISTTTFGLSTDKPVQADYDGDGKTDIAVWRPSTGDWYIRGKAAIRWGLPGDIPVPDDYNGDGKAEIAVWRPSTGEWWVRGSAKLVFGQKGDIPV
jgi:galactose oxidase-like protein/VCBS repeat protein